MGSSKPATTTANQINTPYQPAQPALQDILNQASATYQSGVGSQVYGGQRVAGFGDATQDAMSRLRAIASGGPSPTTQAAGDYITDLTNRGGMTSGMGTALNQVQAVAPVSTSDIAAFLNSKGTGSVYDLGVRALQKSSTERNLSDVAGGAYLSGGNPYLDAVIQQGEDNRFSPEDANGILAGLFGPQLGGAPGMAPTMGLLGASQAPAPQGWGGGLLPMPDPTTAGSVPPVAGRTGLLIPDPKVRAKLNDEESGDGEETTGSTKPTVAQPTPLQPTTPNAPVRMAQSVTNATGTETPFNRLMTGLNDNSDALIAFGGALMGAPNWGQGFARASEAMGKVSAQQSTKQQQALAANQTYAYFRSKDVPHQEAMTAALNPTLASALISKLNAAPTVQTYTGKDGKEYKAWMQAGQSTGTQIGEGKDNGEWSMSRGDNGEVIFFNKSKPGDAMIARAGEQPRPMTADERALWRIGPDAPVKMTGRDGPVAVGGGGVTVNNGPQTDYATGLQGTVGETHQALSKGADNARTRVADLNAMADYIGEIQRAGGTTGVGQNTVLRAKSAANSLANAIGMDQPFDISSPEGLNKFALQYSGQAAKAGIGGRVTNFDLQTYQRANPGLEMSPQSAMRMIGVQQQIAQREADLGEKIRGVAAESISSGRKPDAAQIERMISQHKAESPIVDPVSGQNLERNLKLPEFQARSAAAANPGSDAGRQQRMRDRASRYGVTIGGE